MRSFFKHQVNLYQYLLFLCKDKYQMIFEPIEQIRSKPVQTAKRDTQAHASGDTSEPQWYCLALKDSG